ncbi:InlB B-repeat-containing protein [Slackia isoflavoniconvertens]|uniref:InlB B-repeat-containing protein n=1 Tax=Slackia isoflavoniconvertens TaxID=572010 RepID=UPI003F987C9E
MADRYSFGHKALSVVLSVVLLGFGWPAVNPSETFASDESAQADQVQAEVAQPEETQALEETADDSAAMALATADEAAPVAASDKQAVAEPAADESATASAPSASDEEEASAVEDAVEEDSAVDNQGSSQAAAAQAKTEYDISLVLKNASIKKADGTDELVSSPATKVAVSADKDFKFTVVPDSAYKLNCVLVNVAGQESPLTPDSDDVYVVASSDIAKGATLTVEASSALGNVGTVLGGVLSGGAAAASDVSGNAGDHISAKVGDTVTLKGTSNKNCSYAGDWTVKKNGESTSAGTVKGNGGSATAVFSEAGTFEIEHTYCEASHFFGFGDHSVKTEAFTVVVQPATPAQAISISGSDTVTQFSDIQLTATVVPAEATGAYVWSSSNEDILTVDNSGNVTGVRQGTATVTVSFRSAADGSVVSASKDVTVAATEKATDQASVYYLVDPTKDANSNDSGNWGAASLGIARVNTTGATWTGGKNCFDNVDQRVVSWPNGTNVVPRDSDAWNEIFNNYKTTIQAQLPGVTFTKDDVEEIALVPAKISKNNGTNPDMHLDCNVSIKCKNVALVKYYLRDAGSTQFEQKGAKNYISGNATQPSDVMNEQFPETKTVDGVTYTFSGWYLDQSFTQPATFPYTVNSSTNFYAKYVGGFQVTYDLAGGSWNNSDATTYIAQEGSTQTVKSEPTREGYKFTGWTIEGLPDTTALKSGDTFAMPAGNVTITANWQELLSYRVKYLEKGTEKQLADPDTRYGEQGEKVSADAKTIDGYHLVGECPEHIEKTLGTSDNDIIFWYERDSVEYSVNYYLDGTEQKVADSETKSAPWGTQVKASDLAKDIDGYTAVPNQDATITVDLNGNNSINVYYYQNVSLKANSAEVTYNGKDQSVSGFTGAPEGADFSNITVGAHGTDAGTYDAQFANGTVGTVDKTEKYIVVSAKDGKLVIGKAKVTLKSADLSKKYDGTALENGGTALATETGFAEGEGATYTFTGSQTLVGSSANAFDYTLNEGTKADNYDIDRTEGKLTVADREEADKYEITVTANSATKTYDGTEKTVSGVTDTTFTNDKGAQFTVEGLSATVSGTDAGEYTNEVSGTPVVKDAAGNDVTSQFKVKTVNGKLVIDKRAVTIKPKDATKAYDGKPLKATEWEVVSGSFVDGQSIADPQYDGSQTVPGSSESSITWSYAEGTNADNYNITAAKGSLTVTDRADGEKYEITVTANSAEFTYDGNEHMAEGFKTLEFTVDGNEYTVSGLSASVSGTDAGTYPNNVTGTAKVMDAAGNDVTDQFSVTTESGSLVINKAKATIAPKDATKAYDGTDLKASEFVTEGFVKDQGVKSATFTGSQLNVGTSKSGIDGYVLADGTNANNYDITKGTGNLEVTPVSDKVTVTITGNAATLKYDGTEQSVTAYTVACSNGLYTANDFDFTGAAVAKGTNVGTYKMGLEADQFSNTSANFTNVTFVVENDGSLTISPREVVLTSDSAEKSYDGTALTKNEQSNVKVSGDGFAKGEGASFDITGSQTDAGSSKNTFTYTLNEGTQSANYEITQFEGDLTVNAITSPVVVTIVGDNKQATYDGEEHTAEGYTFTSDNELYTQDKVNFSGEAKAHRTDAGTTTMGLEDQFANADTTNFKNVTFKVTDGFVQVDKAQVTLKSADLNKKYDGTALKNGDNALETESGFAEGEGATYEFTGSQTVVGSSPNAFNYTLNEGTKADNYTITKSEGTLTVTNRDAKYEIEVESNSAEFTYDGNEHMAEGFKTLDFTVDGNEYTVSGLSASVSGTDAGTYSNAIAGTAKVVDASDNDVTDQFSVTTKSGSLVIKQASVHMKSASGEWVYDGNEHAKHEMESVTGFAKGEGATYSYTGAITNAGTVQNMFIYTLNEGTKASNYAFDDPEYGTLKVTPVSDEVTVTIKGNTATETYDGTEKTVRDYGFEASNDLYGTGDFVFTGAAVAKGTNVGTYKMGLDKDQFSNTSANFSNVTFVVEDGWLKIEGGQIDANDVDWTTQDVRKVYDGKPLSAFAARATDKHGNELNVEYSIDGETWTFDPAEISLTHFGSQKVLLRATGSNYAAGQYATSSENIMINKRPVTLTSAGANKVYDGKPLTNGTVTSTPLGVDVGFLDGEGVTCNVTGSQTNAGESDNEFTYTFNEGTSKSDYLVTYEFGKLIVTQDNTEVVVTITEHSGAFEYDGTEKTVSGYDFSASNELYKNTDFEFTGNDSVSATNVGTYDMELKSEDFKNTNGNFSKVTFVVVDGQFAITPKSVDPEAGKGMSVGKLPHVTYNGKSQKQKPEVKDGNTLLTEGTDYTLVYSKDTTNVGTVTVAVEGKGNYAGEAEVTYEILKRQVTLESSSASKVYDGTPLTKPEVTVGGDGFVEGEVSGLKAIGTVTNVADGEVDNEIVWDWAEGFGEGNYDITKTEGKLSIEPQSIDPSNPESYTGIKVGELSNLVYNGEDQLQEPTVTDAKGDLLVKDRDYTLAFDGDAKNVTEVGVSVTVSGIGNYKGDFSRSYKILPREVTVKSASASKAYDGTPLFSHDVVVTSAAGFVEDDVASMTAPNSITEVGSLTNEIAIEWSNDVAAGNYVVLKEEGVLEVTPKSVTAEGFSVEGLNDVTYNGLAQQQEPTVKDGDKTLTKDKDYTLSFTEDVTNVGTVRVTVTGKGNYTGSADVAYQILPAKLIVTTPSDSMVYNGKPLTAEGSIEGFVNNETAVFETTGSQTEVGESENAYAIYWSDEGTTAKRSNYTVEEHVGTLTVTEYADEIVAVANDVTMTYDGMPHRAEVTVTGVPEGYSVKTAWSGAEATDVTGADGLVANVDEIVVVNAEGKDVTDSLKITKKPGKLVIEPKELTVVTMGASKPYDGTPLTANGKIEGFVNGETAAFAVIGSQTEVGECTNAYTIEWSGNAKQGNYTVKEDLGKLEVTKSQAAIVIVPKGGKKTYDGTPLVSEGADTYGLPAGFTCEATTKGSVTNAGSAVAEIDTYVIKNADGKDVTDQFGNVSTGFATLLVTKRPVTVVSEDASKVYDGTPLTKHEAGVTGGSMVDGESFVYEFTGTQTVAGESANSFIISAGDGTNLDNYEITKQDGTLKVEPKGIVPGEDNGMKVTKPVDKVYNGKEQKFAPVVTDGEKVLGENVDYVVTYTDALDFEGDAAAKDDFTNVTGDIFVTVTGIGNYAGSLTQSYQITPKPYTVTTVSGSKVYDGTPLEGASLEGNFVGGLVNDDDATFVVTGTQTEVGASDNTYTLEFVDEQMAKNYKLVKEDIGTLTVVKDESEASQNPNGNGESKNKGALPKTGDMTLATLPFALAVVAGAVLCVAPVARRRSKF